MKKICLLLLPVIFATGCLNDQVKKQLKDSYNEADKTFADQHFKNAIANIELYKLRHGMYPESLKDIDFTSVFDGMNDSSVIYQKLDSGYRLDIGKGAFTKKQMHLSYPPEFWNGLGIRESNVMRGKLPEGIKKIK